MDYQQISIMGFFIIGGFIYSLGWLDGQRREQEAQRRREQAHKASHHAERGASE